MSSVIDQLPARHLIDQFIGRQRVERVLVVTGDGKWGKSELSSWLCRRYRNSVDFVEVKGRRIENARDFIDRFNECVSSHRFEFAEANSAFFGVTITGSTNVIVGNNNSGDFSDDNARYFDKLALRDFREHLRQAKFERRVVFVIDNVDDADKSSHRWLCYEAAELVSENALIDFIIFARSFDSAQCVTDVRETLARHHLKSTFEANDIRHYFDESGKVLDGTLERSLDAFIAHNNGDPLKLAPLIHLFAEQAKVR